MAPGRHGRARDRWLGGPGDQRIPPSLDLSRGAGRRGRLRDRPGRRGRAPCWAISPRRCTANWNVPYGSFSLELDPLSAFFALPVLVLSGLAAIYASRYVAALCGSGSAWAACGSFTTCWSPACSWSCWPATAILFLVAWEVMSLAAFFLITFEDENVRSARGRQDIWWPRTWARPSYS